MAEVGKKDAAGVSFVGNGGDTSSGSIEARRRSDGNKAIAKYKGRDNQERKEGEGARIPSRLLVSSDCFASIRWCLYGYHVYRRHVL